MKKTAGQRPRTGLPRLLALLAMVVMSMPAMAQSRDATASATASGSADWSEFGLVGVARSTAPICVSGTCSAADGRAGALRATILDGLAVRPNLIQELQPGRLMVRNARPSPAQEWRQHLGIRNGEETYNCILSLGIGGELKAGGYVGSQLFGRARTWNRPGGKDTR
jgi:hypothetical protein